MAVLDIAMPILDGLGAARALRALPRGDEMLLLGLQPEPACCSDVLQRDVLQSRS